MAFQLAQENRRAVMHIYNSVSRDVFERSAMKLCESVVAAYITTAFPDNPMSEADRKIVVRFIKCQLFGMCIDWISGGMKDEAFADLRRIIELCRGFPELILSRSMETNPPA